MESRHHGTYASGKQIQVRGCFSPVFTDQLKYFNRDPSQEEDSDSTQQKQHTAAEIQAMLREAIMIGDCNYKDETRKDGDKTSYIQLIIMALDHRVATQEA